MSHLSTESILDLVFGYADHFYTRLAQIPAKNFNILMKMDMFNLTTSQIM